MPLVYTTTEGLDSSPVELETPSRNVARPLLRDLTTDLVANTSLVTGVTATDAFNALLARGTSSLQYFDTTHNPVGLWNFDNTLADQSGNGNNLVLASGNPGFADVVPGKKGVFVWIGARYSTPAAVPILQIAGDLTLQCILQQDTTATANTPLCSYGGPTEAQADNTQYTFNLQSTGAYTATRNLQFDSETGAGLNNTYSSVGTADSLGCIHNIVYMAVTRIANVIRFYVNGRAFGNPSSAFPAPDGGNGPNTRFNVGAPVGSGAVDQILIFGLKVCNVGLTPAQILAEYNRTMGPAFGLLT